MKSNGKPIRKADLPFKICPVCKRPFSWRKKWERVWNEVKYCSNKCSNHKTNIGNDV